MCLIICFNVLFDINHEFSAFDDFKIFFKKYLRNLNLKFFNQNLFILIIRIICLLEEKQQFNVEDFDLNELVRFIHSDPSPIISIKDIPIFLEFCLLCLKHNEMI